MSVVLERDGVIESSHRVHWALAGPEGEPIAGGGDPGLVTFVRSAAKPFQALPLVDDGAATRWGIPPSELALCCASHSGEPRHVEGVRSLLRRAAIPEAALACGPHDPMRAESARAMWARGEAALPIHNNCSGKHAGMLALARHHGWEPEGYHQASHPVQRRMLREVARWTGVAEEAIGMGVDGCGVVCFALPVAAMAVGFARLVAAAARGEAAPRAVVEAMAGHPFEVAGTDRLCTALMETTRGRVVAKVGAEGVYCAADRRRGAGLALKVEDGARRSAEVALVALLSGLELLDDAEREALGRWHEPVVANTRGEPAARLRVPDGIPTRWPTGGPVDEPVGARGTRTGAYASEEVRVADPELPPELLALVRVSGAVAARDGKVLERELRTAHGVLRGTGSARLEEALVQSYLFVGFPAALNALASWRRLEGRASARDDGGPGAAPADEEPGRLLRRGEEVCRAVYGDQYEGLRRNIARLHPDLDRWMIREGYGKVLSRPGLELVDRELCIVALLAVLEAPVQLYSHVRGALAVGAAPERVEAVLDSVSDLMTPNARAAARRIRDRVRARRGASEEPGGDG